MKLSINSRDLPFTIDTYGMFTGESAQEMESEFYREEYKLTDDEWRMLGFDYDIEAIRDGLASASVGIIEDACRYEKPLIVRSIELGSSSSPRFYNYTTDSYNAIWDIDEYALEVYCNKDTDKFDKFIADEWEYEWQRAIDNNDRETLTTAKLDYYFNSDDTPLTVDSYNESMWESETEAYMNNMTLDEDSQKLIDSKIAINKEV